MSRPTARSSGIFRQRGSALKMGHISKAASRLIRRNRKRCPRKNADEQDFRGQLLQLQRPAVRGKCSRTDWLRLARATRSCERLRNTEALSLKWLYQGQAGAEGRGPHISSRSLAGGAPRRSRVMEYTRIITSR